MTRQTITCESCGQSWTVAAAFSVYAQQTLESRPCPRCGAYTLCCPEPRAVPAAKTHPERPSLPSVQTHR